MEPKTSLYKSPLSIPEPDWKSQLRQALRSAGDLLKEGFISPDELPEYERLLRKYPLVLTRYYANLIDRKDPNCPIRRQAIPRLEEAADTAGYFSDPLGDLKYRPAPHLTQRYAHRVLLHLTPNCSMNCRYCFRKTLLNEDRADFFDGALSTSLDYLAATPSIHEVIFSGGDPFLASEKMLYTTLQRLAQMPHLRRLRFHTRVPVTLPMRIDADFSRLLASTGLPCSVVSHFNHPRELSPQSSEALAILRSGGHTLLNQSVLLRGVNDDPTTLSQLSERLFENGVLPYYLHHPDQAQGTAHFSVRRDEGLALHRELKRRLPGYLVPRYVWDDGSSLYKPDVV